jgi:hypothetical protein
MTFGLGLLVALGVVAFLATLAFLAWALGRPDV